MKIAISSSGNSINSPSSPIFGRCNSFIFVDVDGDTYSNVESLENPAISESGAGIKAAQFIAENGAEILVTGSPGPNAFDILKKLGIKVYKIMDGTVEDNLKFFLEKRLEEQDIPRSSPRGRGLGRR
ncbi:Dinitrogenase iron-molybdenum cofactor [anaerobic digester metagenome]